jgi:hypothetical protein
MNRTFFFTRYLHTALNALLFAGCLGLASACGSQDASAVAQMDAEPPDAGAPASEDASAREEGDAGASEESPPSGDAVVPTDSPEPVGDSGLFGIAPNADIQTVTDAQKGQLCDWRNDELGGYGQSFPCGGGTILTDANRAECVQALFTGACVLTLQDFENCVLALAPSHGCNPQRMICAPVYACYVHD